MAAEEHEDHKVESWSRDAARATGRIEGLGLSCPLAGSGVALAHLVGFGWICFDLA